MTDLTGNYLDFAAGGGAASTWGGGIIPAGTNATPTEAHAARVTCAEHALTTDDPVTVLAGLLAMCGLDGGADDD